MELLKFREAVIKHTGSLFSALKKKKCEKEGKRKWKGEKKVIYLSCVSRIDNKQMKILLCGSCWKHEKL